MAALIVFENIWFWREENPVLRGINFSINANERVAVLGASGEGKTTILKLILKLLQPDSGKIFIGGSDIAKMSSTVLDRTRLNFSIVFQEGALFDALTVRDNVAFFFKEHTNLKEAQIDEKVFEILAAVHLEQAANLMAEELSGGMKRRVALARALAVSEAKMFLYDEPTSGLDPINADSVRNNIVSIAGTGKGFIVVTHEILDALQLALRFMFLKDGIILYDGDRPGFLHSPSPPIQEFIKPYERVLSKLY